MPTRLSIASALLTPMICVIAGCRTIPDAGELLTGPVCSTPPPTVHDAELKLQLQRALSDLTRTGTAPQLSELRAGSTGLARLETVDPPAHGPVLPPTELVERIRPSVVIVGKRYLCGKCDEWHTSTATGFAIGPDAVVTSFHVLGDRTDASYAIMTAGGDVRPVIAIDAENEAADIVVLRIAGAELPGLPMRAGSAPGTPLHLLSHPNGAFYYYTVGTLARRFPFRHRSGVLTEMLDITAPFAKGSSGAPVVDSTGAVIGVARATDSVYYDEQDGEQRDLQMVFRRCTPIEFVLDLAR